QGRRWQADRKQQPEAGEEKVHHQGAKPVEESSPLCDLVASPKGFPRTAALMAPSSPPASELPAERLLVACPKLIHRERMVLGTVVSNLHRSHHRGDAAGDIPGQIMQ